MVLYLPLFMMVCWVQSISAPNPNEAHHASSSSSSNPSALPPSYSSLDVSIMSAPWMDTAPEGDSTPLRYEWSSTSTPRPPSSNPSEQPSAEVTSPHAASGIYTTTQVMSQLPEYAEVALLEVHTTTWSPPSMTEHPPTPPSPFNSNLWYRNQKPPWEDPTCSDYFRTLPTIRLEKAMIFFLKPYCGPYIASPDAEEVKFYLNMAIARAIESRTRFFQQYYGSVWTESAMESTIDVLENSSGYFLSSTFDPGTRRLDPKWPRILQMKMARALEITMPLCQCPFRIDSEETHFMSVEEVKYWFNKLHERAKKLVSQYRGD